jgi:hypothetical protein
MSFRTAYGFLTKQGQRWQTPCGETLTPMHMPKSAPSRTRQVMDIERINLIGTSLADLTRRTEALRGYL